MECCVITFGFTSFCDFDQVYLLLLNAGLEPLASVLSGCYVYFNTMIRFVLTVK